MWPDLKKTCIVDTSNFSTLVAHKMYLKWQIDVKLFRIVEPLFFYHPWRSQVCIPFGVVIMDLQMSKIKCVNYAHFPKSGHIYRSKDKWNNSNITIWRQLYKQQKIACGIATQVFVLQNLSNSYNTSMRFVSDL